MNKIISELGSCRLSLIYSILLCTLFTSEYAFTIKYWMKEDLKVSYLQKHSFITIYFLFDDYMFNIDEHGFLAWSNFFYSEDGVNYIHLMSTETKAQKSMSRVWIKLCNKKVGEKFNIYDSDVSQTPLLWDNSDELNIEVQSRIQRRRVKKYWLQNKRTYLKVRWLMPQTCKQIKTFKIEGLWCVNDKNGGLIFREIYEPRLITLYSNR